MVMLMAAAQLGSLLPHVAVPAIMPSYLIPEWGLSYSEAGLMAASYAAGYMVAVPLLATLTDRIDARWVLFWGSLASGLATVLFGLLANGLVSAILIWGLAGIGFAGAYMPGLKALTDRLAGDTSRSVTLYTASFSVGVGLSFLVSQLVADHWGWRQAFVVTGIGPAAMAIVALMLRPVPPAPRAGPLLDFRPVLRNRTALGYVMGYGAHCFELYGMRTWIVAFWGFVTAQAAAAPVGAVAVSASISVLSLPASLLGNEAALRFGRHRAITVVMLSSAVVAVAIGVTASVSIWLSLLLLAVYAFTVPADSGALTSGVTAAADPNFRGATLALHSMVGFGLSALGGWAVGIAIDAAGGPHSHSGWLAAFLVMAAGILLGPLALWWSRRMQT
ncbi:MAG TPA: MFS transporter [Burkholderiales bacterium]|nr:MFS transporter [Burkholderiales bacterium]